MYPFFWDLTNNTFLLKRHLIDEIQYAAFRRNPICRIEQTTSNAAVIEAEVPPKTYETRMQYTLCSNCCLSKI